MSGDAARTAEKEGFVKPTNDDEYFPTIGIDIKASMKHTAGLGWTFEVRLHAIGPDDVMVSASDVFDTKRDCAYALMGQFQDRIAKLWREYNDDSDIAPEGPTANWTEGK